MATAGTFRADASLAAADRIVIPVLEAVALNTMDVSAVAVPHDAASPIAVVATARRSGARIGVAYDLGRATDVVRRGLADLDVLIIESNHDEGMLRAGPYPPSVSRRIAGPLGHLSNTASADLARSVAHHGLSRVVLAHLSATCNEPALALGTMKAALTRGRLGGVKPGLSVALQDSVAGPFGPGADQLALGF